jgi:hypothetical protein
VTLSTVFSLRGVDANEYTGVVIDFVVRTGSILFGVVRLMGERRGAFAEEETARVVVVRGVRGGGVARSGFVVVLVSGVAETVVVTRLVGRVWVVVSLVCRVWVVVSLGVWVVVSLGVVLEAKMLNFSHGSSPP